MRKLLLFNLSKLFMLAVMLLGVNTMSAQYSGTGTFNKISTVADVTDGYYVIGSGSTIAMNNTNSGYFGQTTIAGSSGTLTNPNAAIVWKIETTASGKTIYNEASGTYVSYTGTANAAQAVTTLSTTVNSERWTVGLSSTLFTLTNVASNTRLLEYNSGATRFACYTGTQANLTLYKLAVPTATAAPVVTASAQTPTVGTAFSYQVSATNSPTSYAYTGTLPTGLSFSTTTGLISGNPTTAGSFSIDVTATNGIGTSSAATISFVVAKGNQTITFGTLGNKQYGDANFALTATASSSLAVTYVSSNTSVATISGSTVTVVGIGTTTITASQAGTANYNAATSVDQTLTVTPKSLTITGVTIAGKTYDSTNAAIITGTPALTGVLPADSGNVTLSGTPSAVFSSVNYSASAIAVTVSGYTLSGSAAGNYTLVQPTGLTASISKAPVTIMGATAVDKDYDTTTAATITNGTLTGVFSADTANVAATTGTFSNANAGTNLPVTIVLTGTKALNYTLTQPGITGNINKAAQTITFAALTTTTTASASVTLTATASSGLTVTYTSSNTSVATIATSGASRALIAGAGTTTITASQAGNANYLPATAVLQQLIVSPATVVLASWDFYSITNGTQVDTRNATTTNTNLTSTAVLTRGPNAAWSTGTNSFRTAGFSNDGISTANQDYYQTKFTPKTGYKISLSTIDATFNGGTGFVAGTGALVQFAYSLDGINFKLINSPVTVTAVPSSMTQIVTSNIADLQNIIAGTTVTFRFYATGQSATGTFGLYSKDSGDLGLAFGGYVSTFTPTTWTSTGWSNGAPTATSDAVIAYAYDTQANGNITSKSLYVNSDATLNVATGTTVAVTDNIANNATTGSFVIQNNGALVQTNENLNTGSGITVNKSTNPLYRLDYTLWSAPVTGQTLAGFSPETAPTRFYEYKYDTNTGEETYTQINATTPFTPAKSYLIRMPNTSLTDGYNTGDATIPFNGIFSGTANNGTVTIPLSTTGKNFTAVGNPYASPINLAEFFTTNSGVIDTGSGIYMWRKKNDITAKSYAILSLAGFVANSATGGGADQANLFTTGNSNTWLLATGQGFFVKATSAASSPVLTFTNSMRRPASGSIGFLREEKQTEVSRLWLNLTGDNNAFSQTAVAYIDGATTGLDYGYDVKQITDGSAVAFYSVAANNNLVIQARPAFDATDVVPMGFVANTAGSYTIHLDHTDGVFSTSQDIYLKDNMLGFIKNIKEGDYTFNTNAGTFTNRFEVVYNKTTLGATNPQLTADNVIVFKQGTVINVNSSTAQITGVAVYDVRGRKLYSQDNINNIQTVVNGLAIQEQVIIVEVTTIKGKVSKKIIF